jgi:hypothetical protein
MDDETQTDQADNEQWTPPEQRDENVVGGDGDPVGDDNIREGKVRGNMHGGPTASQGQGQGG